MARKSPAQPASPRRKRRSQAAASAAAGKPLHNKVVLVTGGNRGMGFALARAFAQSGASVIITGRDEVALKAAAESIANESGKVRPLHCDVREPHSVERLFRALHAEFGGLDILVNNAGLAHPSNEISKLRLAEWQEVIETNLTGMFLVTRAALVLMRDGGTVVNNVSVAARTVFPGMAAYTASKHGALGFTDTLREELRPRRIRVLALMAGATDTAIWDQIWPQAPRDKMMSAESIAAAVVAAVLLPENTTVSELIITPTGGAL